LALTNFIPTLWSARIYEALRKSFVYAQEGVINRDYEGEIRQAGDTVRINSIADPTITDYVKNTDMATAETLSDSQKTLQITQAKSFHFQIDDIDRAQQQPKVMDNAMSRAAYKLSDITDQYVASVMAAGADTGNAIGSDNAPIVAPSASAGATGAYEQLVDLNTKLNEANVPRDGRFVIVPPWYEGVLDKDDRFINNDAASPAAGQPLLNGRIGRAAGFQVLVSNNVPTNAAPSGATNQVARNRVIAGHVLATTFADQINEVEAYRPERRFADAVKGLHLYGASVIEPAALAVLWTTRS
jgi:N4-gp56 family major capsid protein